MKMDFLKPYYPHKPISSIDVLARTLGVHPKLLVSIADRANESYTSFEIVSSNGKIRVVSEPKFELKKLQKRINHRIFECVNYPSYLQGGIKDDESPRDYVKNATCHIKCNHLISLDVKNFYPNIRYDSVFPIFKYFFKFPDDVSELLSKLVTLHGRVPQGACTSSYIANLIFFNSEYHLVSSFHSRGIRYSRLLDDINLSSFEEINEKNTEYCIKEVAAMLRKHNLKFNNKKKRIDKKGANKSEFKVTGLWVEHGTPKLRKSERRFIRQLVYICEKEYKKNPYSQEYHELWHRTSGKVAKLTRLKHAQSKSLRFRMRLILPLFDLDAQRKLTEEANKLLNWVHKTNKIGHVHRVNKCLNDLGILSRTNRSLARSLKSKLKEAYSNKPTIYEFWEG